MVLTVDRAHLGTTESEWRGSGRLTAPPLLLGRPRRAVVVAPHPDDEVLGAGGLVQRLLSAGVPTRVVAVTDGEASDPHRPHGLGVLRSGESLTALGRLGWSRPRITRLGLPDGAVTEHVDRLTQVLTRRAGPADLWVAPWAADGHPDHDACGRVVAQVARDTGGRCLGYLVWAWHWADPASDDLPWSRCRRLNLGRRELARKRWAIAAYRSQIEAHEGEDPVLLPAVLQRFRRPFELFVDAGATLP
jgi:LmbE family N-acetylglucosaminyl deacetylase